MAGTARNTGSMMGDVCVWSHDFLTNGKPLRDTCGTAAWQRRNMKTRLLSILSAFLALLGSARADGFIIIHNPPPFPPPHPHMPPPRFIFAPLEVVFHKVDVDITGQKAVTRVEQEFFNPNNANLEGEYIFPIPKGAHLDKFTMRVGDKDMEAELLDAAKARAIYEDIVRRQKDPALLEYTGRAAFRVRIFPIEPHSRKKVTLAYTELLKVDGGLATYLYPLNTEKFSAQPLKTVAMRVNISQDAPIKALYSPSHSVDIRRDGEKRAVVGWEASNARPDTDFQLLYSTADTEVGVHLLTHKKEGEDGWFLVLASPGADVMKTKDVNPKDVVFVMDTSGSMAGKKLEQLKKAMTFCVENLNDTDRFELVRFSTEAEPFFERLTEATKANRDKAQEFIKGLRPIGGTAIADALDRSLKMKPANNARPFVVVFLTDGKPTIGETDEERIVARVAPDQASTTRIFCFGIGTDINTHLLDKIAERTRAASQFVLPEEDLEVKVSNFFTKIKEPLLTNLKLEFPAGVRVTKLYPNPLPDLFRGDQLVLAGRYSGDGEGDLVLDGTLNGQPKRMAQRVKFSAGESGNEFIAQLWALRRVGWLLDEVRLRGENKELRDEVVDLARRYAIVTPYTSYLIVEDEARRGVPVASRSFQMLDKDAEAKSFYRKSWGDLSGKKDGYDGALNGRGNLSLKNAEAPAVALEKAKTETFGGVIAGNAAPADASAVGAGASGSSGGYIGRSATKLRGTAGEVQTKLGNVEQQTCLVNGKAFTQNGSVWCDTGLQSVKQDAKRNRVQFASKEYFDLLTSKPESAQWLALGRNVQFTLGAELYEVFE
jgi:Ca-activated chloride channel family protein